MGLTHRLIYPQYPCEHSRENHYFTSSITSDRQRGKGMGGCSPLQGPSHKVPSAEGRARQGDGVACGEKENVSSGRGRCGRGEAGEGCSCRESLDAEHAKIVSALQQRQAHGHVRVYSSRCGNALISDTYTVALVPRCEWACNIWAARNKETMEMAATRRCSC